ncbi:MAG TPA: formimidoylglutamase [candidate division Zixibacteria bacterium]
MTKAKLDQLLESSDSVYAAGYSSRGPDDARLGDVIVLDTPDAAALRADEVVVIGFPQDEGVRRNFGRPGAAAGPDAIRSHFARLVAPHEIGTIRDWGNVRCNDDLEATQAALGAVVSAVLRAEAFPLIIGGGHETAFGHFLGYAELKRRCGVVNLDAHLDVRPLRNGKAHSGSPFRQMAESKDFALTPGGYLCIGVQEQSNNAAAFEFIRTRQFQWLSTGDAMTRDIGSAIDAFAGALRRAGASLMMSVDLDCVRQSDSPGVSAPSPVGFTSERIIELAHRVMQHPVASVDISECNPALDRDGQTARLAALIAYEIIRSRSESGRSRRG